MDKTISPEMAQSLFQALPILTSMPTSRCWVDYDQEADVLYMSFERPQKATDATMTDEGILLRYRGSKLVGITILEASTRQPAQSQANSEVSP